MRKGNYKSTALISGVCTYDSNSHTLLYTLTTPLEPSQLYTVDIDKDGGVITIREAPYAIMSSHSIAFTTALKTTRLVVRGDDITPFEMTFTVPAVGRMTSLREKIARGVKAGMGGDRVEGVSLMLGGAAVELKEESDVCALKNNDVLLVRLKGGVMVVVVVLVDSSGGSSGSASKY